MKDFMTDKLDTLAGEIRDAILDEIRQQHATWAQLSENGQRDCAERVEKRARHVIASAVRGIASRGFDFAVVHLKQLTIKDGIEGKIIAANVQAYRDQLGERVGSNALMVFADPEEFMGADPAEIDPDQPALPAPGA